MSRRCSINIRKGVMSGNNVSHSNRKTKRKFIPNMQRFSLMSEALNRFIKFRATPSGVRVIEHRGGLDKYLISTPSKNLCSNLLSFKKKVIKELEKESVSK